MVYHAKSNSREVKDQLEIMAERLFKIIMTPASLLTIASGFTMFFLNLQAFKTEGWLHTKIMVVFLLWGHHFLSLYYLKKIKKGHSYSPVFFRIMNETPTVLLIIIIILVVIRPF